MQTTLRHLRGLLCASLFIAFAVLGAPAYGQSTTVTTTESIPFTSTLTNTCNGDLVTFQGNMQVTNHVTTDASGGFHLKTHVNYQNVTGTGAPSGLNYRVGTTSNETTNDPDGPQAEMTVIQTVKLISQGSTQNNFIRFVYHITINANGVVTSTVAETSIECRGAN
jgi:hypothetical protein